MKNIAKIVLLLIPFSVLSQGPWTQEKGKSYTQLSFTSIPNYDALFGSPDYSNYGSYTDNTLQVYAEYGLTNTTTLIVSLPLKMISIDSFYNPRIVCVTDCSQDFKNTSLGNIELGIKHQFYKKDWVVSGQVSIEANTGAYESVSGIRTGYNAWTFTPLLLAGKSFGNTYLQTFFGTNIRTNGYSSNLKIGGEYGGKIIKNIWLIGFIDIVKSFKNGNVFIPDNNVLTGLYVNDQEYGSFGAKMIGEFTDRFGVTAGFGGAFFGNNVAKQAALTIGLYHKF